MAWTSRPKSRRRLRGDDLQDLRAELAGEPLPGRPELTIVEADEDVEAAPGEGGDPPHVAARLFHRDEVRVPLLHRVVHLERLAHLLVALDGVDLEAQPAIIIGMDVLGTSRAFAIASIQESSLVTSSATKTARPPPASRSGCSSTLPVSCSAFPPR